MNISRNSQKFQVIAIIHIPVQALRLQVYKFFFSYFIYNFILIRSQRTREKTSGCIYTYVYIYIHIKEQLLFRLRTIKYTRKDSMARKMAGSAVSSGRERRRQKRSVFSYKSRKRFSQRRKNVRCTYRLPGGGKL